MESVKLSWTPQPQPYPGQPAQYNQPYPGQPPQYNQPYPGQPPQSNQYTSHSTYVIGPTPVQQIYVSNRPYLNFTGALVFSCIVFWCCGCLFGLIAFILAMIGQSSASNGDVKAAKSLLVGSYIISAIGVLMGIALIAVLTVVAVNSFKAAAAVTVYELSHRP